MLWNACQCVPIKTRKVADVAADEYVKMPFGKHRGECIADIPVSYLGWVLLNVGDLAAHLRSVITDSVMRRRRQQGANAPNTPPLPHSTAVDVIPRDRLKTVLRDWFRKLTMRHHPDRGNPLTSDGGAECGQRRVAYRAGHRP